MLTEKKKYSHEDHPLKFVAFSVVIQGLSFVALFWFIRIFTWKALGFNLLPSADMQMQARVSGYLADTWMGIVVGLLVALTGFIRIHRLRNFERKCVYILGAVVALILSGHIPYVEFFGTIFSIGHFRYFLDLDFLKSSGNSFFDWRVLLVFTAYLLSVLILTKLLRKVLFLKATLLAQMITAMTLIFVGALSQVTKVQLNTLKFGWKTPLILRVNFIENLFIQTASAFTQPSTSNDEISLLAKISHLSPPHGEHLIDRVRSVVQSESRPAEEPVGLAIKKNVLSLLDSQQPVYVFVVLLESFRPEESKFFTPEIALTHTPFFDSLAGQAVVFDHAFSVGGVTRAGQEAVFCGLMSGEKTSAMREIISSNPTCLPALLKKKYGSKKVFSAWWHGGQYNYDSQGTFWKRRGIDYLLSSEDFNGDAVSTYWGYSDFALVERFKKDFSKAPPEALLQTHLFLSITNHPAWTLPSDAPQAWTQEGSNVAENQKILNAPHQLTARYTDEALSRLIRFLKATPAPNASSLGNERPSVWDRSIVFVTNDHGHLAPSQVNPQGHTWGISQENDQKAANSASHLGLVLTGGLVDTSIRDLKLDLPFRISRPVSQADIYSTIADFSGAVVENSPADSLFAQNRRFPVVVDLADRIFIPGVSPSEPGKIFERDNFLKYGKEAFNRISILPADEQLNLPAQNHAASAIFFKAYQTLLLSGQAGY